MIVDMKKLLLFGNNKEKSRLMKILHKMGCVEVSLAQKLDNTSYIIDENKINEYTRKLTRMEFYFDFIEAASKIVAKSSKEKKIEYKPVKTSGLLIPKQSLTYEEFANSKEDVENDVFEAICSLEKISEQVVNIKNKINQLETLKKQLEPFKAFPVAFNKIKDTKNVVALLGNIALDKIKYVANLEEKGAYVEVYQDGVSCAVCVLILKDNYDDITDILSEMEFSLCTLKYDEVPIDMINNANREIEDSLLKITDLYFDAITYEKLLPSVQRLHDFYSLEVRKLECEGFTSSTQTSYYLEAWVPALNEKKLDEELETSPLTLSYILRDPIDGEVAPSYCENNTIVDPYESVTNMFSSPKYKEIDPNPFVAFFFFLFFGMMLSDAGYGLILTIGAGLILLLTKPKKGQSSLIKIVFMGGISTIIWGAVFGSYFGLNAKDLGIPYWFNPIDTPMNMLYLSLGMGIFQMLFGTGIKAYADFKNKDVIGGLSDLCWMFLVIGLGGFAGSMLIKGFPSFIKTIGLILLVIGIILLLLSGAHGKKGAKKITGALAALYGIINFFSDLMSYTRIFGLGLATAVIGMVFNQIGVSISSLVGGGVAGFIVIAIIAIIGHTFNMAINALGAYVHNSRLQFVEFFGKFYEGGGELFRPLGSEMKYYYINNEKNMEVK